MTCAGSATATDRPPHQLAAAVGWIAAEIGPGRPWQDPLRPCGTERGFASGPPIQVRAGSWRANCV